MWTVLQEEVMASTVTRRMVAAPALCCCAVAVLLSQLLGVQGWVKGLALPRFLPRIGPTSHDAEGDNAE